MGAVHSTVNLALSVIPQQFLLPGLFIIACFISMAEMPSSPLKPALIGATAAIVPIDVPIDIEIKQACSEIIFLLFPIRPSRQSGRKKHK
jgi:hypothetical protein